MINYNKVYIKLNRYALYLEDERRYKEAEEHFVKAGKPSEAVNMYSNFLNFLGTKCREISIPLYKWLDNTILTVLHRFI
jgi:hypothetical protein